MIADIILNNPTSEMEVRVCEDFYPNGSRNNRIVLMFTSERDVAPVRSVGRSLPYGTIYIAQEKPL